jgi:uncharacterized protein YndB with AHSA1/START domain
MTEALKKSTARAVADVSAGMLLASIEIAASPERVFKALTSEEIAKWWGGNEYKVTRWTGELKVGGKWRSEGIGHDGKPFAVIGEFLEIDAPRKLVQTWSPTWESMPPTRVTYLLAEIPGGTRVTVRHEGFAERADACNSHTDGWERVLTWLSGWVQR